MGRWPRRLALLALVAGIVTWLQRAVLPSRPATAPSPIPRRLPDPDGRPSATAPASGSS
jgi:hypothetical protein